MILLAALAILAWWYFDGSRRMTEEQIRASYHAQAEAMEQFDADKLCERMSDDFAGEETQRQGGESVELHYDKATLCKRLKLSMAGMQRISHATGGMRLLAIELEIKSIELSTDRKHATVETVSTARLGDKTLARDRTTEHLIRRNGRILTTGGESRVWAYAPQ